MPHYALCMRSAGVGAGRRGAQETTSDWGVVVAQRPDTSPEAPAFRSHLILADFRLRPPTSNVWCYSYLVAYRRYENGYFLFLLNYFSFFFFFSFFLLFFFPYLFLIWESYISWSHPSADDFCIIHVLWISMSRNRKYRLHLPPTNYLSPPPNHQKLIKIKKPERKKEKKKKKEWKQLHYS